MSGLIRLSSAITFEDIVFVDPDSVILITPLHKSRDMGEYSTIYLNNGVSVEVVGNSTIIQERINKNRGVGK